jgi:hypothetical protein
MQANVVCSPGDKIKVFWLHGQIYDAKIIKQEPVAGQKWPRFFVHYLVRSFHFNPFALSLAMLVSLRRFMDEYLKGSPIT